MSELDRIRKEIDKKYKAVTNKISRTKRTTGANVAGSEFDPRMDSGAHNRMRSEARASQYLDRLNLFMSRNNQFIAGSGGAPLPKGYFNKIFKSTEKELNTVQDVRDATIGAIQGPEGFTIAQKQTALPQAGGASVYGPYKRFDREASDITSFSAMKKLQADMVKQIRPDYLPTKINAERERLDKVIDYLGENGSEIGEAIQGMDDYEFDLFWFGTTAASGIFLFYELEKERADGNHKERKQDRTIESKFGEVMPAAEWALNQGKLKREAEVDKNMANLKNQNGKKK